MTKFTDLDRLCIKAFRVMSAELPNLANSGHPGAPMGMAAMTHVLFTRHMRFDPKAPTWFNRDRFVLSNGHACAMLYTLLHLTGYEQFTLDALKQFRQVGSIVPGHPENYIEKYGNVGGVEVTTGPLGQGISNAVGLALAQSHLAALHGDELINNFTYVTAGDGCLQEGVASEACSLAGHWKLGKLIVLYDDNKISIDGDTDISFTEDVAKRFDAYGWQVLKVADGDNDLEAIDKAISEAKADTKRPTIICVRTTIGVDSKLQGTAKVHGSPLGGDDIKRLRELYKLPADTLSAPQEVLDFYHEAGAKGAALSAAWQTAVDAGADDALRARLGGALPADWEKALPSYAPSDSAVATRKSGGAVLAALKPVLPALFGGSADLTGSNLTVSDGEKDYQHDNPSGTYLRFGVREHGMAAICNGLARYQPGAIIPYCATFLNFLQYCLPAVRLSALSHCGVVYVMTHDSIGLGEDGPTHQPINAGAIVRSTPNALFLRPADGTECAAAWAIAVEQRTRPSVLALSRQNTPNLEGASLDGAKRGGYRLSGGDAPSVVLVGTGTELALCVDAAKQLDNAAVVSMVSMELFFEQSRDYRRSVLPDGVPVLSVEALSTFGWSRLAHASIGMTTFGMSGPAPDVYKHFGITVENVVAKAKKLQAHYGNKAPVLDVEF